MVSGVKTERREEALRLDGGVVERRDSNEIEGSVINNNKVARNIPTRKLKTSQEKRKRKRKRPHPTSRNVRTITTKPILGKEPTFTHFTHIQLMHEFTSPISLLTQPPQPMFTDGPRMGTCRNGRGGLEIERRGGGVSQGTGGTQGAGRGQEGKTDLGISVESKGES